MTHLNRDSIVAVVLLAFCAVMFAATYRIKPLMIDPTVGPEFWPRIAIGCLAVLSLVYLAQSLRGSASDAGAAAERGGWGKFLNPCICFILFGLFTFTLPFLGMLIGGTLFVFLALTLLGPGGPRHVLLHLAISVIAVGGLWAVFTFALDVYLPPGHLLRLI